MAEANSKGSGIVVVVIATVIAVGAAIAVTGGGSPSPGRSILFSVAAGIAGFVLFRKFSAFVASVITSLVMCFAIAPFIPALGVH